MTDWPEEGAPPAEFVAVARQLAGEGKAVEARHLARLAGAADCDAETPRDACPFDAATETDLARRWAFGWSVRAGARVAAARRAGAAGEAGDPFELQAAASPYGGDDAA